MNPPTEPRVRRATVADAKALAGLRYEFRTRRAAAVEAKDAFLSRSAEWMRAHLADDARWQAWVLDDGVELIGNIWLQIVEKVPNPGAELERHAYVTNFFVRPEHRGRGAGSRLLHEVKLQCAALDVDTIFLWPSDESRPLYARHGFTPADSIVILKLKH